MSIVFLAYEDVLLLHRHEVDAHGGEASLRDEGLLRSAIAQPTGTFSGEWLHEFPHGMAAAYLFHIAANHPFVDGNKRAAFASAIAFLHANGLELETTDQAAEELVLGVARGETSKERVIDFFRENVRRRT